MTAISGTRRTIKELVDGTVRVQIDIDPQFRRQFFELFPTIDMPVALAPLTATFSASSPDPREEKPKGGELAKLAGILCADPEFQLWLEEWVGSENLPPSVGGEEGEERAAIILRHTCGVQSRAELDHWPGAAAKFHETRRAWLNRA